MIKKEQPLYTKILFHVLAIIFFLVLSMFFFKPVYLENKTLSQHDVSQYAGSAEELRQYYDKDGESSEWTGSMFSGMPAYQIDVWGGSPNFVKIAESPLKSIGATSAGPIFTAMLVLYIILILFGANIPIAMLGAIAYGFASYNLILIDAGHINKIWNLAYMPLTISGFLFLFRNKFYLASICLTLGLTLQIRSNHIQMTYYTAILGVILFVYFMILKIKEKEYKSLLKVCGLFLIGLVLALSANVSNIYTNYEMAQVSTRGPSDLVTESETTNKPDSGLDKDYVFMWSYGIPETMTFLIPNVYGGSSVPFSQESHFVQTLIPYIQQGQIDQQTGQQLLRMFSQYWGDQPSTSGPVYFGAVLMVLFVLGMCIIKNNLKWVLFGASIFFILLAWGNNFVAFNDLIYDYFPLYNKFRAVSQTLVIPSILFVFIAVWGLMTISQMEDRKVLNKPLFWIAGIMSGICLILWIFPDAFFSFVSQNEEQLRSQLPIEFFSAVITDRRSLLSNDALRSLLFIIITFISLWITIKNDKNKNIALFANILLVILVLIDMWGIDRRYIYEDKFLEKNEIQITPSPANREILKDQSLSYRVLNLQNTFGETQTSYFHRSIGGYHAAKLQRYQQLIDYKLSSEINYVLKGLQTVSTVDSAALLLENTPVLNMLDTRYLIYYPEATPLVNPYAMGNAWFVDKIQFVANANEELDLVGKVDMSKVALVNKSKPYPKMLDEVNFTPDSTATIEMVGYKPNILTYKSKTKSSQLAVFSEIYYPKDWVAYIDGNEYPIFCIDWLLRGLVIPEGEHEIIFKFEPTGYHTARLIESIGSFLIILLLLLAIGNELREFRKKEI